VLFLTAKVCCSSLTANIFEAIGSIATNNKGELSAFCHALTGARELARPGEEVLILSDSDRDLHHDWRMYGAWALRKNKALVERNRRALAALRADGTAVRFQQPLLGCGCLDRAAWLDVPRPPCVASGAARVRGLSSARRAR